MMRNWKRRKQRIRSYKWRIKFENKEIENKELEYKEANRKIDNKRWRIGN